MTVADTIKKITSDHLKNHNGVAIGQCLTAVGWVGGTVPELSENDGIIELSMADIAGSGIVTGLALAGRRPIYIVRYQGFQWYNAVSLINYAAKSKDMWDIPCPVFIRSIAMDGGIGPVAGSSHHSIFTRMPGIPVCAPMTPNEYIQAWEYFMLHDDPLYVSEHRKSFSVDYELKDIVHPKADVSIFSISSTRLNVLEAQRRLKERGIVCNVFHILWLKPFIIHEKMTKALKHSRFGGVVLDGDFENGIAKCIGFDLMQKSGKKIHLLCLEERTAGFAPHLDNLPPTSDKIYDFIVQLAGSKQ